MCRLILAFSIAANFVLCSAFQTTKLVTQGGVHSHLLGIRAASCKSQELQTAAPVISRRGLGTILIGAAVYARSLSKPKAAIAAATNPLQDWKQDAGNGFANYTSLADGVKYKDIEAGIGSSPKTGDYVRFQLSAYLLDGTLVSSYAGVELSQV